MKKYITVFIISFVLLACNETKKEGIIEVAASFKSLEVEIEGMTCEIGCARLIESKLSKVDGVTYSKVSFEAKKGQFTYDENKLSKENLIAKINGIAGGDLYKVIKSTDLKKIIEEIK
ncbi:cation transporter [uncultured Lutibacter sp.]|uniref:cation transporter n=1 Tax=uncultured Lutibacter sp. TaxID=437739 RepID=UPI002617E2EA|nr:heavy metal-associated domain-containing protein [uncultured Lutibacter sp.]